MQLQEINKQQYRTRLKHTTFAVILSLFAGSLALSSIFISLTPNNDGNNFYLNLAGVFITVILTALFFINAKSKPYFSQMYYVFLVKFELTHIQRKIKSIETAAKDGNQVALNTLAYYYQATHQIWSLDDNTLTIDEFVIKENKFKQWVLDSGKQIDVNLYHRKSLQQFN